MYFELQVQTTEKYYQFFLKIIGVQRKQLTTEQFVLAIT